MKRGFTIIELMIVLAVICILGAIIFPRLNKENPAFMEGVTVTPSGLVSEQCLGGFKFIVDANGTSRQVFDEYGKGVRCHQ